MIDELQELRRANRHQPDDLDRRVEIDPNDLIAALRSDASPFWFPSRWLWGEQPRRPSSTGARLGWACALAAVAAAVVVAGTSGNGDGEVDVGDAPPTVVTERPTLPSTSESVAEVEPPSSLVEQDTTTTTPSTSGPVAADVASTSSSAPPDTTPPTTDTPTVTSVAPTTEPTTAPTTAPSRAPIDGPFADGVDLLVVHLDFAHRDDGHAALASREIAEWFGLDPLLVAGTVSPDTGAFAHPYDEIMTTAWGSAWIDASADRAQAVASATARWLTVLDAGGNVWVAEGGVSDFSAEVIRAVRQARPELDTSGRVHVVQHSQRNERESRADDLAELAANAAYIRIDDGNSANDTADLNQASNEFELAALSGPRSGAWSAAFDYHPAAELDFSDTVTVLHVLGIGTDQIADPGDFAAVFMAAG